MPLSNFNATVLIISSILGYGMLTMPHAFAHVGILYGTMLLGFISIITIFSVYLIFESAIHLRKKNITYYELMDIPYLNILSNLFIFLSGYFACISYFRRIVLWSILVFKMNEKITVLIFFILHLILSIFMKSLRRLNKASILSGAALFILFNYLIFLYFTGNSVDVHVKNVAVENVYGIFIFSLTCQNFILSIFNEMRTTNYLPIIGMAVFGGFLLCFSLGYFGFHIGGLAMRDGQYQDILSFLFSKVEYKTPVLLIVMFSYILLLNCSYLFQLFPSRIAFIDNFEKIFSVRLNKVLFDIFWATTIACSYFFETSRLLNLQGLIIGNSICFIFPGIGYLNIRGRENMKGFFIAILVILFGVLSMAYSLAKIFF